MMQGCLEWGIMVIILYMLIQLMDHGIFIKFSILRDLAWYVAWDLTRNEWSI